MEFYLLGFVTAFLIGIVKIFITSSTLLSMRARNLKKVGMHYNCMSGNFEITTPATLGKFVFYCIYMLALAPIFSWLSVASASWMVISWLTNKAPAPEKVKEIQFKIANVDLPKDQIISLLTELENALGVSNVLQTSILKNEDETEDENEDERTLITSPTSEVSIDPNSKMLFFYSRSEDYWSEFKASYEYKFEESSLRVKCIKDCAVFLGKEEWRIKDGVVLKSEIQKKFNESEFKIGTLEEKISRLESETQWHDYNPLNIKFFVMKFHPELFPKNEYRRQARLELERIKAGLYLVLEFANENNVKIENHDDGYSFSWREGVTEVEKEKINMFFEEESLKKIGITMEELYTSSKVISFLESTLGESQKAA